MLSIRPIDLRAANRYVLDNHRHNGKVLVHRFSIACYDGDRLCGVAIVANPSARKLDDGRTVEVKRVCTDGTHNACSILYGRCARIAKEMGWEKIITYTLDSEGGGVSSCFRLGDRCGERRREGLECTLPPQGGERDDALRRGDGQLPRGSEENQMV